MTFAAEDFGARLRRQRELNGVALDAVANSTKIKRSLLVDLERGDLSRWPAGIFRRAFLREYATAIGACAEDTVRECLRLFPEPGEPSAAAPLAESPTAASSSDELRLTLASGYESLVHRTRVIAVLVDTLAVAATAITAAIVTGASLWTTAAVSAVLYYGGSTVLLGTSPASWYVGQRLQPPPVRYAPRPLADGLPVETTATRTELTFG